MTPILFSPFHANVPFLVAAVCRRFQNRPSKLRHIHRKIAVLQSFLHKLARLLVRLQQRCSCEYCKIFKNSFFFFKNIYDGCICFFISHENLEKLRFSNVLRSYRNGLLDQLCPLL